MGRVAELQGEEAPLDSRSLWLFAGAVSALSLGGRVPSLCLLVARPRGGGSGAGCACVRARG